MNNTDGRQQLIKARNRSLALGVVYIVVIVAVLYLIWGVFFPWFLGELTPMVAQHHLCTFYSEDYTGRSC